MLGISVLLLFSSVASVKPRTVEKQAVLTALTLNVARFTRWPEYNGDNSDLIFNFCVVGNNVVQQSFEQIDKKRINGRTIHVIPLLRFMNFKQCQLLYVSTLERSRLIPLLAEMENRPILTVGESSEFLLAGGMVGLESVDGKMQLKINLPALNKARLVMSSRLLKLAEIVDFTSTGH